MSEKGWKKTLTPIIKGVLFSLIFLFLEVLIFALIVKITDMPDTAIRPVNQFLKVAAIFLGSLFSIRGSKGYLKGLVLGFFTILFTYLIFSFAVKGLFNYYFFIDLLFGSILGLISGSLAVNVKKKS